jgi:hypothetical protein
MTLERDSTLKIICDAYGIALNGHDCAPFGSGLINTTYLLKDRHGLDDWILQQVNTAVFKRPELIAYNNYLAAEHLRVHHPGYLFMSGRRTLQGKDLFLDRQIGAWRVFPYMQNSVSYNGAVTPAQAFSAAQQFGRLTHYLDGVYVGAFKVILPDFHNLSKRYQRFRSALEVARKERLAQAALQCEAVIAQEHIVSEFNEIMADPAVSTRITHNDTKVNNVLFDRTTGKAMCVVDLDTLMPGKALFDLGDMIRTFICAAPEDDPDPAHTSIDAEVFARLVEGWCSEMGSLLTATEKSLMYWSGQMLMYEQAVRFLTDFLENDVYYRIDRPLHNLDRTKNQLHLLSAYTASGPDLERRINHLM